MAPTRLMRLRPRSETLYISHNHTVLITNNDGILYGGEHRGFFADETRMLSEYRYLINGEPPKLVAVSAIEQHSSLGYYISGAPDIEKDSPAPAQHAVELRVARSIDCGMHEDIDITNYTRKFTTVRFELCADADFADFQETAGERKQHGELTREWKETNPGAYELVFDYKAEHDYDNQEGKGIAKLHRSIAIQFVRAGSQPVYEGGRIVFAFGLPPHGSWHCCALMLPVVEGRRLEPPSRCYSFWGFGGEYEERQKAFAARSLSFGDEDDRTLSHAVLATLNCAKDDVAALRFNDVELGPSKWISAAGLPIYVALFGRDTLAAAWQYAIVNTGMLRGTLMEVARLQGTEENDWRDEQPGKMFHEAHNAPLAVLNFNPRSRYYGSITTSAFYAAAAAELWHWTGSKEDVSPFLEPSIKAVKWLDRYGDFDGDGLYEYKTRSAKGLKNQGWKDSGEAIVYEDGREVDDPITILDVHGFAFASKMFLSELLWWFDRKDEARILYQHAMELKKRFNERFWMEDEEFFAMGLDPQKRQIRSIGSGVGLCLATGIVDENLVQRTSDRLMADDLFSGWGVRSLSSKHPAYNPYSYQRGSVWPVEQGTIALGFMRYGLIAHMHRLAKAQFEVASLFDHHRMPEVFGGQQRTDEQPFPALYPDTNWPQAWSATSVFTLIQSMLGIVPYAPMNILFIDPHLPEWLPELTLRGLRVGDAELTIKFKRKKNGVSGYRVLEKRGSLHILRQPSPWSLTATFAERIKDSLTSLLPAH